MKAQRISTVSNGGHTIICRTVSKVTQAWGMEKGFITYLGQTYRVSRTVGQAYWEVGSRVWLYPAGHPLESLNPPEFRKEAK